MAAKSEQLQIRVSVAEKAALRRHARAAGVDVSTYVLARALPTPDRLATRILESLASGTGLSFALAELNDMLAACPPIAFPDTVHSAVFTPRLLDTLTPFARNYVAAMVEQAARQKQVAPPSWTREIEPLEQPYFASTLRSLRQHLIAASPVPFKRRGLFIDATTGNRV